MRYIEGTLTPKDVFPEGGLLAIVDNNEVTTLRLVFDKECNINGDVYRAGDNIEKQIFTSGELDFFKAENRIKKLPHSIFNEYELESVVDSLKR